jgi:hypothetical protein
MSKLRTIGLICVLHLSLASLSIAQPRQSDDDLFGEPRASATVGTEVEGNPNTGQTQVQVSRGENGAVYSESRSASGEGGAYGGAGGGYSGFGEGGMRNTFGGEMGGGFGWFGSDGQGSATAFRMSLADRPMVIVTQPIQPQVQLNLKEDLNVMDKLLSEQITRVDGEPNRAQAMGIRISMPGISVPIYIEGCGALFSYRANLPLAPSGKGGADDGQSASTPSWERAKRELAGRSMGAQNVTRAGGRQLRPEVIFRSERYDELLAGILKVLPEAANIRHLSTDEFVFVTVSGFDDAGKQLLLVFKAKKADIDAAAEGKITPDAFKARVAMRMG